MDLIVVVGRDDRVELEVDERVLVTEIGFRLDVFWLVDDRVRVGHTHDGGYTAGSRGLGGRFPVFFVLETGVRL